MYRYILNSTDVVSKLKLQWNKDVEEKKEWIDDTTERLNKLCDKWGLDPKDDLLHITIDGRNQMGEDIADFVHNKYPGVAVNPDGDFVCFMGYYDEHNKPVYVYYCNYDYSVNKYVFQVNIHNEDVLEQFAKVANVSDMENSLTSFLSDKADYINDLAYIQMYYLDLNMKSDDVVSYAYESLLSRIMRRKYLIRSELDKNTYFRITSKNRAYGLYNWHKLEFDTSSGQLNDVGKGDVSFDDRFDVRRAELNGFPVDGTFPDVVSPDDVQIAT